MPGRIYAVDEEITSLELVSTDYPIVINYECQLSVVPSSNRKETSAINNSIIWGQVSGIFADPETSKSVLTSYDYSYLDRDTYRIFNPNPDSNIITDAYLGRIIDSTNYNVYKTTDILAVIKQEVQKQVEKNYGVTFEEDEDGNLTNGSVYYSFGEVEEFDIEADPGTVIVVDGEEIKIGYVELAAAANARYDTQMHKVFEKDAAGEDVLVGYQFDICHYGSTASPKELYTARPQFLIVNYKCSTREEIKESVSSIEEG